MIEGAMNDGVRLIKRYAGVRLYDTAALAYVTAEQVRVLRREGAVVVEDAMTGEDVTRALLEAG